MEKINTCPTCKMNFDEIPNKCTKCGYPFSGTEKEKSIFVGQQILKKSKIGDTKDKIKRARIILFVIGGLNILFPVFYYIGDSLQVFYIFSGFVIGMVFIAFGFLTFKIPFMSILISLILLILFYAITAFIDVSNLLKGIVWKVFFISGLVYALYSIIEAEKIRKESEFMKEQKFK